MGGAWLTSTGSTSPDAQQRGHKADYIAGLQQTLAVLVADRAKAEAEAEAKASNSSLDWSEDERWSHAAAAWEGYSDDVCGDLVVLAAIQHASGSKPHAAPQSDP